MTLKQPFEKGERVQRKSELLSRFGRAPNQGGPDMKAAVYYENGDPSVLKYEDVLDPVCHPKGVVIRVEAVSIEGGDTLNRLRGPLAGRPHIVGYQAAGEIVEVGAEVETLKLGQKVATSGANGSHA